VNVQSVTAMVLVQEMDRALRFYRDTLGLTVHLEQEDWAVFAEGVGLMLSPEPLPQDNISLNAVMITLNVDDVHGAYHELVQQGVAFLVGPTDVGGAIVASFRDTEGNLLQLVETQIT
jgi:predicted enzyme related to lactoylglutathione lyase